MSGAPPTELDKAFQDLGLRPDHWRILLPIPVIDLFFPTHPELKLVAAQFDAGDDVPYLVQLHGHRREAAHWEVARRVLAWQLVKRLEHDDRERYFARLVDVTQKALRLADRVDERCGRMRRKYRELIDQYLGVPRFTLGLGLSNPVPPPEPAELLAFLPRGLWWSLLAAPVVRFAVEQGIQMDRVMSKLRDVRLRSKLHLTNTDALELLSPVWEPFLARDGPPMPGDQLDLAERLLARGLAGIAFAARDQILDLLDRACLEMRPHRGPGPAPQPVARLRRAIDDVRGAAPAEPLSATDQALATLYPPARPQSPEAIPVAAPVPAKPPPEPTLRVTVAEGFQPVPLDAAIEQARGITVAQVQELLAAAVPLLFDDRKQGRVAVVRDAAAVPASLWVVGDVHADVFALANLWRYVSDQAAARSEKPHVVFLGDFVDRGEHDHATLLFLFRLIRDNPGQIAVVAGNHDVEFGWDDAAGRFTSRIEPSEYAQGLNAQLDGGAANPDDVALARLFVQFIKDRPRAVFLPDGLLLTHGGFPHTDLHAGLTSVEQLSERRCPQDFTWLRVNDTSARKRPNPGNKGCQFGWDDLAAFARACAAFGVPVRRMVRGHDHVLDRYLLHTPYRDHPVLTINAMSTRGDDERRQTTAPALPVVARYVPGELPEVVRLPVHPPEAKAGEP